MVEQPMAENSSFGRTSSTKSKSDTPTGLLKLDWQINDSNVFELTGIWNKTRTDLDDYTNPTGQNYLTTHSGAAKKLVLQWGVDGYRKIHGLHHRQPDRLAGRRQGFGSRG